MFLVNQWAKICMNCATFWHLCNVLISFNWLSKSPCNQREVSHVLRQVLASFNWFIAILRQWKYHKLHVHFLHVYVHFLNTVFKPIKVHMQISQVFMLLAQFLVNQRIQHPTWIYVWLVFLAFNNCQANK